MHDTATRASLLIRLADMDDQVAWTQFVHLYGPMIHQWCLFWKLQDADAEEVTQALIVKLFQCMRDFHYDPSVGSFRGWLKTVTRNAVLDYFRRRRPESNNSKAIQEIHDTQAYEDFAARIEQVYDMERLEEARQRVRQRVAEHTWRAFELATETDQPVKAIAEQTGLQVAMVYVAKSKVIKMLREEMGT